MKEPFMNVPPSQNIYSGTISPPKSRNLRREIRAGMAFEKSKMDAVNFVEDYVAQWQTSDGRAIPESWRPLLAKNALDWIDSILELNKADMEMDSFQTWERYFMEQVGLRWAEYCRNNPFPKYRSIDDEAEV
jgi:hypothetical protein